MDERSDEDIVHEVQKGDIEAFGLLADRYQAKLSRYAKKFLFDKEDSQDLVQEVFLKAYQNIQDFDAERRFSPWIYRIAHNEFVNALKRRERSPLLYFDPDLIFPQPIAKETADAETLQGELREVLDRNLAVIDAKYREPLVLYFYEELDYKEISEILKIPVATVGVRLQRGKALLRTLINKDPSL